MCVCVCVCVCPSVMPARVVEGLVAKGVKVLVEVGAEVFAKVQE